MNRTVHKKDIFYYIILSLTLIIVIIGTTFAIYTFLHSQKEGTSAVYTGTLSIEYLSGDIIKCHDLRPTKNIDYTTTKDVYKNNFKVTNTGTLDSLITIYLDINKNEFSDKYLKYKIYNEANEEVTEGNITGTGKLNLIDNLSLEHETATTYTLIIWLQENGKIQNEDMLKSLTGTIKVDANQKIE